MNSLISVINKIHDALSAAKVDHIEGMLKLPQIVVIGSQSSGKSSVLESFVGREFLPRGSGIVTRRPLVLKLVRTASGTPEYAEFQHRRGHKYTDFALVRKEIEDETDRETGRNKGISPRPINLAVYSPNVVDLTLVDLPGFARVAVGDQPKDIEERIKSMAADYVFSENTLVLAVTAANVDLATSEALQFAQIADPDGSRTIGVITKLDLMDEGTDAYDVLVGRQVPLRLGYVGVVCRGQKALSTGQSVADAVAAENAFFRKHPRYRLIADKCGTQYLQRRLNEVLTEHIRRCLPELRRDVQRRLEEARKENERYVPAYGDASPATALLDRIKVFSTAFGDAFNGCSEFASSEALFGGARVRYIFTNVFPRKVDAVGSIADMSLNEIHILMTNMASSSGSLFFSDDTFEELAKAQLALLEQPATECVDGVLREMVAVLDATAKKTLGDYPRLFEAVVDIVLKILQLKTDPTKDMLRSLVRMECAYINKSNPDFDVRRSDIMYGPQKPSAKESLKDLLQKSSKQQANSSSSSRVMPVGNRTMMSVSDMRMTTADMENAEKMRSLVAAYVDVIKDKIKDVVPKTIMCFLINATLERVGNALVETLYKGDIESLMSENDELVEKRRNAREMLAAFEKASAALSDIQFNQAQ